MSFGKTVDIPHKSFSKEIRHEMWEILSLKCTPGMILVTSDIHFNLYFNGSKISIICFCNVQHHINFDYVISSANKTNQNILLNFLWCEKT